MTENFANAVLLNFTTFMCVAVVSASAAVIVVTSLRYWRWKHTFFVEHGLTPVVHSTPGPLWVKVGR